MVHLTQPSNSINLILELEKRNFLFGVALSFSLFHSLAVTQIECFMAIVIS